MTFEVEAAERGLVIRYIGPVSLEGIAGAVQSMAAHERFHADLPTVWDFSESTTPSRLDADDMRRLERLVAPLRRGGGRPRVAIVTPRDANFAGARMFGGLTADRLPIELNVFRDGAEARSWAFAAPSAEEEEREGDV